SRVVHQVLIVEVRTASLSREQRVELGAQLARELGGALPGGDARRLSRLLLTHAHVVPARDEPGAEQRRQQRGQQAGGLDRARRARRLQCACRHAYPAPLTDTISVGAAGSVSSFLRSTAIAMSTARVCRSPRWPNTCSSSSARETM